MGPWWYIEEVMAPIVQPRGKAGAVATAEWSRLWASMT